MTTTVLTTEKVEEIMSSSIGTEKYYRPFFFNTMVYTDGVRTFAEHCQAHWVIDLVNSYINQGLDVVCLTMSKEDAIKSGAECMFIDKYPDVVTVYKIGNVSSELCGGPHVKNTKELGHFKIIKEESSSANVRRIKAILE